MICGILLYAYHVQRVYWVPMNQFMSGSFAKADVLYNTMVANRVDHKKLPAQTTVGAGFRKGKGSRW